MVTVRGSYQLARSRSNGCRTRTRTLRFSRCSGRCRGGLSWRWARRAIGFDREVDIGELEAANRSRQLEGIVALPEIAEGDGCRQGAPGGVDVWERIRDGAPRTRVEAIGQLR